MTDRVAEPQLPAYASVARRVCVGASLAFAFVYLLNMASGLFTDDRPPGMKILGPIAMASIPIAFVAYAVWWWGHRRSRSERESR